MAREIEKWEVVLANDFKQMIKDTIETTNKEGYKTYMDILEDKKFMVELAKRFVLSITDTAECEEWFEHEIQKRLKSR